MGVPTLVPTLDGGYQPWMGIPTLDGVATLDRGYLLWMAGTYLGQWVPTFDGVPMLDGEEVCTLDVGSVPTLDGGKGYYLEWVGGTYLGQVMLWMVCHPSSQDQRRYPPVSWKLGTPISQKVGTPHQLEGRYPSMVNKVKT